MDPAESCEQAMKDYSNSGQSLLSLVGKTLLCSFLCIVKHTSLTHRLKQDHLFCNGRNHTVWQRTQTNSCLYAKQSLPKLQVILHYCLRPDLNTQAECFPCCPPAYKGHVDLTALQGLSAQNPRILGLGRKKPGSLPDSYEIARKHFRR